MLPIVFFSLLIGINGNSYGCPTNVTCIEKETCCQTKNGLWSCCPIENGVCCDDGFHCCSKNEKCLTNGKCSSSNNRISFAFPLKMNEDQLKAVPCPDGSSCQDAETCCQLASSHYACCPHPDAVCCSDHIHCCPKDHTCDTESGHCKRQIDQLNSVPCPDGSTACPDGYTCCLLPSGEYGCCPLADAVCCSDRLHCCPHGNVCDTVHQECLSEISIPWFNKTPSFHIKQELTKIPNHKPKNISQLNFNTEIICPDAITLCESKSTCCLTSDNDTWGCCPVEKAVCCSDHKHCCPSHYKCDLSIFTCNHDTFNSIPMLKKQKSIHKISSKINLSIKSYSIIQCPDGNYCPEETTCCETKNDTYGCCPYPEGTCCSDKIHCCGNGYSCDDSGNRCIRLIEELNKIERISSSFKFEPIKKEKLKQKKLIYRSPKEDQLCPDERTKCPSTSTCCPNKDKNQITYSCCPYTKGVCCGSNGSVCCPNNYDCNEEQLSCELRDTIVLREILLTPEYYQCPSSTILCSTDETCCNTLGTSNQDYACCPYTDAQCCSDGSHCCPSGTVCDMVLGGCY